MSFTQGFDLLGGAVGDIFAANGEAMSASGYKKAAAQAGTDATIAGYSGAAKEALIQRQAYGIIGGQQADVAGAGFAAGGSAGDLERDSFMQAHVAMGASQMQTDLQVDEFKSQQQMDLEKAQEANNSGLGDIFGAVLKGISLAVML